MSVHKQVWEIAARNTCPDCMHRECMAICDAAENFIRAIEEGN